MKESAGLSPSALSKQISTLQLHGDVEVRKGYVGNLPRTWVNLNDGGRAALEAHTAALQRIVEESRRTASGDDT
ncbi:transcriptional regulator [Streptomyces decoyicus]|uniref:transcriptional regulator n=1 Tax=Streptomyces decoyicus TaxID=249567 RepID=UPI003632CDD8